MQRMIDLYFKMYRVIKSANSLKINSYEIFQMIHCIINTPHDDIEIERGEKISNQLIGIAGP
jgi:hypothetical protein